MATQFGHLPEFQSELEPIAAYLERVNFFFMANNIPDDKQVPILLSTIGGKTYSLLRDLLVPAKPGEKTLAVLKTTLQDHFEPQLIVIAERFYFHQRSQNPDESVADHVAELRRLAKHCAFGPFLDNALHDRLVCG